MKNTGLIYGYSLDGKGGGDVLTGDDINNPLPEGRVSWLHFDYTHADTRQWISENSQLDQVVIDALLTEESRPRSTQVGDGLLIALRGVNASPGSDPEDMVGIRIWIDKTRIISTRRRYMLAAKDMTDALASGVGPTSPGNFLVMISAALMVRMQETINDTEDNVDSIEEELVSSSSYDLRNKISAVRRIVISLRRYLAPQRDALLQMHQTRIPWLTEDDRQLLREVTDTLIRYIEDLDSARDRAAVAQEELSNRLAEQMNSRMYLLSLVAAVFLPLGFFTGLLGINVGGMPGAENPWAFWIVSGFMTITVGIQLWLFKRKNWF
ncbi:zinc transporter ZntB [Amphritea sp. 2_MG-2023]|jgi:zinc transporter|uniref:zinc transporter ZntB n=1 Tax=Amphritea TaxID=515417 RepID=UPI001C06B796|nr:MULTISPECIES: zinc transporter ZntB [Amphritea]MBU2966186.1 zinc transporter ZntB [Amphritea atlantica]MDO6417030.1 zinc transporter ZntB [Amphritea sp. 2_MG-2023]